MGHPDHVLFPFLGNSNEYVPKIKHSPSNTKPPPVPNNGNSTVAPQQRHMARNSCFLSPSTYGVPGHSSIGAHKLQVCRVFAVEPPFHHRPTTTIILWAKQRQSVSRVAFASHCGTLWRKLATARRSRVRSFSAVHIHIV